MMVATWWNPSGDKTGFCNELKLSLGEGVKKPKTTSNSNVARLQKTLLNVTFRYICTLGFTYDLHLTFISDLFNKKLQALEAVGFHYYILLLTSSFFILFYDITY